MKKPHILVIEDEPRMRANIATILRMEGFDTTEASHGREGVELASKRVPDLILCDISMPELDGHETLRALQQNPDTAKVPFIFLTARGEKHQIREGMNGGADDYLVKPFEATELLDSIHSRLKRAAGLAAARGRREPKPELLIPLGLTERGVVIATRESAQVVAPFDGKVIYAGPFRGYGQIVMIEHGDDYLTLLAGLSSVDVQVGQGVLAGEPIARMGAAGTGAEGTDGLYVEFRHNGAPIDPLPWWSARTNKVKR